MSMYQVGVSFWVLLTLLMLVSALVAALFARASSWIRQALRGGAGAAGRVRSRDKLGIS